MEIVQIEFVNNNKTQRIILNCFTTNYNNDKKLYSFISQVTSIVITFYPYQHFEQILKINQVLSEIKLL